MNNEQIQTLYNGLNARSAGIRRRIEACEYDGTDYPDYNLKRTNQPLYMMEMERYRKSERQGLEQFKTDLLVFGQTMGLNEFQLKILYDKAYDDGHSNGFLEILDDYIDEIVQYLKVRDLET